MADIPEYLKRKPESVLDVLNFASDEARRQTSKLRNVPAKREESAAPQNNSSPESTPVSSSSSQGSSSGSVVAGVDFGSIDNAALIDEGVTGFRAGIDKLPAMLQGMKAGQADFAKFAGQFTEQANRTIAAGETQMDAAEERNTSVAESNMQKLENRADANSAYSDLIGDGTDQLGDLEQIRTLDKERQFEMQSALGFRKPVYVEDANGQKRIKRDAQGNYMTEEMGTGEKVLAFLMRGSIRSAEENYANKVGQSSQLMAVTTQRLNQLNSFIASEGKKITQDMMATEEQREFAEAQFATANNALEVNSMASNMLREQVGVSAATLDTLHKVYGATVTSADQYMKLAELGKSMEWYKLQSNQFKNQQDKLQYTKESLQKYKDYSGINFDVNTVAQYLSTGQMELIDPNLVNGYVGYNSGLADAESPANTVSGARSILQGRLTQNTPLARAVQDIVDTTIANEQKKIDERIMADMPPNATAEDITKAKLGAYKAAGVLDRNQFLQEAEVDNDLAFKYEETYKALTEDPSSIAENRGEYSFSPSQLTDPEWGIDDATYIAMELYGDGHFKSTRPQTSKEETTQMFNTTLTNLARDFDASPEQFNAAIQGVSQVAEQIQQLHSSKIGLQIEQPTWLMDLKVGRMDPITVDLADPEALRNGIIQLRSKTNRTGFGAGVSTEGQPFNASRNPQDYSQ